MESIFESLENLNVSEECFDEIVNIVEEFINERNKENRQAKKKWEMDRGEYSESPVSSIDSKERSLKQGERAIKSFKKYIDKTKDDRNYIVNQDMIDQVAKGNRLILGRHQNPVSFSEPAEYKKAHSDKSRAEMSQRGSVKDSLVNDNDPLKWKHSYIKDRLSELAKKKNNKVSESLYNEITDLVGAILDEGRQEGETLSQYKGRLQDKYIPKLRDEKATQSALRKHEEKKAKQALRKEKEIKNTELPKAEYNKQIASGDFANAAARYNYELERNGKHNPVTKRALEAVKHFRKKDIEAGNALDAVKDRMSDERIKAVYGDVNADAYKRETGDIADKIRKLS